MSLLKSPRSLRWLAGGAAIGVAYFAGVAIALSRTAFYLALLIVVMEIVWIGVQIASPYVGAVEDVLLFLILLWQMLTALQLYFKTNRKESIQGHVEPERQHRARISRPLKHKRRKG